DLVRDREFGHLADRFDVEGAARIAFGTEFGPEFVPPFEHEPLRLLDLQHLAGVAHSAVFEDHLPRRALLPLRLVSDADPVGPGEFGAEQRIPQLLWRGADIRYIDVAVTHRVSFPDLFSGRSEHASACARICRSSGRRSPEWALD